MATRKVKQGECFFSIAADVNIPWETLWNLPQNSELKSKRKPNVLYPGDKVFIPDKDGASKDGSSDDKHTFKVHHPKTCVRLKLLHNDEPLKDAPYKLTVDGVEHEGKTDGNGLIFHEVKPAASEAVLEVEGYPATYTLKLGYLDPVDSTAGLQARLNNLGFDSGKVDDAWGKVTRGGMQGYQSARKMETSTKPDDRTRSELEKEHGS